MHKLLSFARKVNVNYESLFNLTFNLKNKEKVSKRMSREFKSLFYSFFEYGFIM